MAQAVANATTNLKLTFVRLINVELISENERLLCFALCSSSGVVSSYSNLGKDKVQVQAVTATFCRT